MIQFANIPYLKLIKKALLKTKLTCGYLSCINWWCGDQFSIKQILIHIEFYLFFSSSLKVFYCRIVFGKAC